MVLPQWRNFALVFVLVLLDSATTYNVFTLFRFFEPPLFAGLIASAFVSLQIGCLILFAQDLPASIRQWLVVGAGILLCMTAVSNAVVGYLHGQTTFPAQDLLPALGIGGMDEVTLSVVSAWVAGASLAIVGLIFWTATGSFIRMEGERRRMLDAQLQEIFSGGKADE